MNATPPASGHIELSDDDAVRRWCEHFGVNRQQLEEAVAAAGAEAGAVHEHLLNQGGSAGAG